MLLSGAAAATVEDASGALLSALDVRAESICLCVIDDCLDADVPLLEFTVHGQSRDRLRALVNLRKQTRLYSRSM